MFWLSILSLITKIAVDLHAEQLLAKTGAAAAAMLTMVCQLDTDTSLCCKQAKKL